MRKNTLFISGLLVIATVAAYFPIFSNGFIGYDDWEFVTSNPHVKAGLNWDSIRWAFQTAITSNWHPLTWMSHMLDCQLFGLSPAGHHFVNLILHIANTLLLFFVFVELSGAFWQSTLLAALFSLHPLHVESVAWVSERKDTLSTLFWFLTILAYGRYVRSKSIGAYIKSLIFFVLGLLSKPMLVTLPCTLLLLDYWPLGRFQKDHWKQILREKIPFFILSVIFSIITMGTQIAGRAISSVQYMGFDIRIKNMFVAYAGYLKKTFWPQGLTVFYPHPFDGISFWEAAAAFLFLLLITVFVLRLTSRYPYLGAGWFWYLGTLVPVIGLIQVGGQALADRYTYIPLIGIFIMMAWGVGDLQSKYKWSEKKVGFSIVLALAVVGLLTWNQVRYWKNDITLFEHALRVTKRNYIAHNGLGLVYVQEGKIREAIEHFTKSLEIYPNFPEGHNNLGLALNRAGEAAKARLHLFRAVSLTPNFYQAYNNLANVLLKEGNYSDAIRYYSKAVEINPYYSRGYYNRGVAMATLGNYEAAEKEFEASLRLDPSYADAQNNLSIVREKLGKSA